MRRNACSLSPEREAILLDGVRRGMTWQRIGLSLGVSGPAAHAAAANREWLHVHQAARMNNHRQRMWTQGTYFAPRVSA